MKKQGHATLPDEIRNEPDGPELERLWDTLDHGPDGVTPDDTDRAWYALAAKLGLRVEPAARPSTPGRTAVRTLLRAAAVVVLCVGAAATWYAVPVTRTAGAAQQATIRLPDGSAVTLNAGSTLRYRRGFAVLPGIPAGDRAVRLEGEGFFDVQRGVLPFRVEAGDASVRVLGTRFNVRARRGPASGEGHRVQVEVEQGRVEVWTDGDPRSSVILGPGEAARLAAGSITFSRGEVAPGRIGLWRTGGLTAVDEPLSAILTELSLRFGVRISLIDPHAGTSLLSVYYPTMPSLESVLSDLATQQDLRYRQTSDGWELF